jgi:hypothetical protein
MPTASNTIEAAATQRTTSIIWLGYTAVDVSFRVGEKRAMPHNWCVLYRTKAGPFAIHSTVYPNADEAVMALVYDQRLQIASLVVELWKAQLILQVLNSPAPPLQA